MEVTMALARSKINETIDKANRLAQKDSNKIKSEGSDSGKAKIVSEAVKELTQEVNASNIKTSGDRSMLTVSTLFAYDKTLSQYLGDSGSGSGTSSSSGDSEDGSAASGIDAILNALGLGDLAHVTDLVVLGDKLKKLPTAIAALGKGAVAALPYIALIAMGALATGIALKINSDVNKILDNIDELYKNGPDTVDENSKLNQFNDESNDGIDTRSIYGADVLNGDASTLGFVADYIAAYKSDKRGNITLDQSQLAKLGFSGTDSFIQSISDLRSGMSFGSISNISNDFIQELMDMGPASATDSTDSLPIFNFKNPLNSFTAFLIAYYRKTYKGIETDIASTIQQRYDDMAKDLATQVGSMYWEFYDPDTGSGMGGSEELINVSTFASQYNAILIKDPNQGGYGLSKASEEYQKFAFPELHQASEFAKKCYTFTKYPSYLEDALKTTKQGWFREKDTTPNRWWLGGTENLDENEKSVYRWINIIRGSQVLSGRAEDQDFDVYMDTSIEVSGTRALQADAVQSWIESGEKTAQQIVTEDYVSTIARAYSKAGVTGMSNADFYNFLNTEGFVKKSGVIDIDALTEAVNEWDTDSRFVQRSINNKISKEEYQDFIEEYSRSSHTSDMAALLDTGQFENADYYTLATGNYKVGEGEVGASEYISTLSTAQDTFNNDMDFQSLVVDYMDSNNIPEEERQEFIEKFLYAMTSYLLGDANALTNALGESDLTQSISEKLIGSIVGGVIPAIQETIEEGVQTAAPTESDTELEAQIEDLTGGSIENIIEGASNLEAEPEETGTDYEIPTVKQVAQTVNFSEPFEAVADHIFDENDNVIGYNYTTNRPYTKEEAEQFAQETLANIDNAIATTQRESRRRSLEERRGKYEEALDVLIDNAMSEDDMNILKYNEAYNSIGETINSSEEIQGQLRQVIDETLGENNTQENREELVNQIVSAMAKYLTGDEGPLTLIAQESINIHGIANGIFNSMGSIAELGMPSDKDNPSNVVSFANHTET